jgi:hypothetical protein
MLGYRPNAEETDRALKTLSDACRRRLLFELYEEVNSKGGGGRRRKSINYTDITPLRTERKQRRLYHIHLPKLDEFGYITWNEANKTIQKGPRWEEIEPLLELISTHLSELPPILQGKPSGGNETEC